MARSLALGRGAGELEVREVGAGDEQHGAPARPMSSQTIMMLVLSIAALCIGMTLKPRPALSLG